MKETAGQDGLCEWSSLVCPQILLHEYQEEIFAAEAEAMCAVTAESYLGRSVSEAVITVPGMLANHLAPSRTKPICCKKFCRQQGKMHLSSKMMTFTHALIVNS